MEQLALLLLQAIFAGARAVWGADSDGLAEVRSDPLLGSFARCLRELNDEPEELRSKRAAGDHPWLEAVDDVMSMKGLGEGGAEERRGPKAIVRWPHGRIPYVLEAGMSRREKLKLACAQLFFHEKSCVRWEPRAESDRDYVFFRKRDYRQGCFSEEVGVKGGRQVVNFGLDSCWRPGILIHELMHTIGFLHEQARNDRDAYVRVHWDNIPRIPGWKQQFLRAEEIGISYPSVGEYDFQSLMHYPRFVLSRLPSMSAKKTPFNRNNGVMGNRRAPTQLDLHKINLMYACPATSEEAGSEVVQKTPQEPSAPERRRAEADVIRLRPVTAAPTRPLFSSVRATIRTEQKTAQREEERRGAWVCRDKYPTLCKGHFRSRCSSHRLVREAWCSLSCNKRSCALFARPQGKRRRPRALLRAINTFLGHQAEE